jgi:AbrB family looped-hinge helix DNA binding protein
MHYSTITSKGQVTIPVEVREKLELSPGSKIEFIVVDEYIVVIPINKSVGELKGILPKPPKALSCKQMDKIIKGKHDQH